MMNSIRKQDIYIIGALVIGFLIFNSFRRGKKSKNPEPPQVTPPGTPEITEEQAQQVADMMFSTFKKLLSNESKMLDQLANYSSSDLVLIWNAFNKYYANVRLLKLGFNSYGSLGNAFIRELNQKELQQARYLFAGTGIHF
ncbi:MAG: hypothetical protein GF350_04810 [Chitinivibrionales bacterium]|nr:hypothetical protein [Chitinivibrionales bacterium]